MTQQWKDFLNSDGASAEFPSQDLLGLTPTMQPLDFPSNDTVSLGLNSRDFSNGDGASLALNDGEFSSSDGESLPQKHSKDVIPSGDGISPTVPPSNGLNWTLNF